MKRRRIRHCLGDVRRDGGDFLGVLDQRARDFHLCGGLLGRFWRAFPTLGEVSPNVRELQIVARALLFLRRVRVKLFKFERGHGALAGVEEI